MLVRYQCQLYETPGYATVRLRNQINKYTCMTPPKCHYTETVSYFVFYCSVHGYQGHFGTKHNKRYVLLHTSGVLYLTKKK